MPIPKMERRTTDEIEVRQSEENEGIIEGYFVTWDKLDTYKSMFKKGAFAKTIKEKGLNKIRVLWNHENGFGGHPLTIIGKPLEIKEDDTGVFVRAKILTDLPAGANAWRLMTEGIINTLSFGFSVLEQSYDKGKRIITDVDLYEFSPVAFPANPDALITAVRAADFDETLSDKELSNRMTILLYALENTLNDIWWDTENSDGIPALIDKAIDSFKDNYMAFVAQYIERHVDDKERPATSEMARQLKRCCNNSTISELAQQTQFTLTELRQLQRGKIILQPERLKTLSEGLFLEYQKNYPTQLNDDEENKLLAGVRNLRQQGY